MAKVGLIAGGGQLPLEFISSAKREGDTVVVFAIEGMAGPDVGSGADRVYWLNIGQFQKCFFLLLRNRIRKVAFLGKVDKNVIYQKKTADKTTRDTLEKSKSKNDYAILEEISKRLAFFGIEVIDSVRYLRHLLPEKGVLSATSPNREIEEDITFGFDVAKKLAGLDIGQTLVVKDKTVVAVEAMEGTDQTIRRAGDIAGEGCVMVKVSRPHQDFRWDVPTVGPGTIERLVEAGFSALAIESERMFFVERDKCMEIADSAGIVVKAL
ncbi:MAG: UDP-2,3-diacylglucosamine diphosphatase LpxI [Candidatus Tantalella remota]|nr:UDP-2,3-diacylglucosamine diphosphatase LpxI [Candidatus Tantalella remota]